MTDETQGVEHRQRIAVAAAAALLVAGLVLVMFVLPAEYGIDPLGTGARVGLVELGAVGQEVAALEAAAQETDTDQVAIIVAQDRAYQEETVEFTVAAGEGMEYKYRLDQGEALLYAWIATGPVNYELHAEPDGAPRGYAQTYELRQGVSQASGTLTAPFSGIHGWFWENLSSEEITVTLTAAGFYNVSHEFRTGSPVINKMFQ